MASNQRSSTFGRYDMKVRASIKKFRKEGRHPQPLPVWTVFLMTDAATEVTKGYEVVLSDRGRDQVSAAVTHLRSMTKVTPEVWEGAPYPMHDLTAEAFVGRLGRHVHLRDHARIVKDALSYGNFARFGALLTKCPLARPIVLVALHTHCERLLQTAGVEMRTTGRAVRSSRVYPVEIDRKGNVRLSSLLDYATDAPEFRTSVSRPSSDPRD